MAMYALRLRRALPFTSSTLILQRPLSSILSAPTPPSPSSATLNRQNPKLDVTQSNPPNLPFQSRAFRSSAISLSSRVRSPSYNNNQEADQLDQNAILFEGCDYNHWLITMDFPKDPKPSAEEMVETYVQTAAKVLGSVEEAKKKIYACSTTTYNGFQVEVSEEVSEKFRGLPGVVFILPDSYIDPVNKEYGGDKYINGTIIPRPPPVQYGRQKGRYNDRNRDYDRPPRQQMQQNYGDTMPMNNAPGGQGHYQGDRRDPMPSYQGNYNQGERRNYPPPGQRDFPPRDQTNYPPPGQRDFRGDGRNYAPPQGGNYRQGAGGNYGPGAGGNYGPGAGGNYAPGSGGNSVPGTGGNSGPGVGGNYGPGSGGNSMPGSGGNSVPGAGRNYGQGAGGNYGQGAGGNYGQGADENYGQGVSGSYGQGAGGSYGQRAGGNYGQGVGGAHGREVGSGYMQSSPGYGENPHMEQRNNIQGQQGKYADMEEAGTTQGRY